MLSGSLIPFGGVRIIEDWNLTDSVADWSEVRSHSRAKRRLRRGFRQRIKYLNVPKKQAFSIDGGRTLYMHPIIAAELRRAANAHSPEAPSQ